MTTSGSFISRIKYLLIILVFVFLTSGFILIGAHLQMLNGVMPIANLNGLYINTNVSLVSMIPIPNTGGEFIDECESAILCDDFSAPPVDWSSKGTSMGIQNGALHFVTGLFPKARMITWNESNYDLPKAYSYSADMLTSSENDIAGLAINIQPNGEGTVFLFHPVEQSFFIGQWANNKLVSLVDWKSINLEGAPAKEFHLEIQCIGEQANFLINGISAGFALLAAPCNVGSVGIFLDRASWQLWADNVHLNSLQK